LGDIFFRLGAIGDIAEFFRSDFGILPIGADKIFLKDISEV
jgi:hypothetical protein